MIHDTQSAQISQKQDERNIYVIMKTMCPPGYHHNGFVATHALGHMMYGDVHDVHDVHDIYIYIYIYNFITSSILISFCSLLFALLCQISYHKMTRQH